MKKKKIHSTNEKILEASAGLRTPFSSTSTLEARHRVMGRISEYPASRSVPNQLNSRTVFQWRYAAALAALVILPYAFYFFNETSAANQTALVSTIQLPDGSIVELSPGAELQYNRAMRFTGRMVRLNGSAFFDVVKGDEMEVSCPFGKISVRGTSFSVNAQSDKLWVHCSTGIISVHFPQHEQVLHSGEFCIAQAAGGELYHASYPGITPMIPGKSVDFEDAPIQLVVAYLEQLLGKKIVLELPGNLHYTGTFEPGNDELCLEIFCKSFGATARSISPGTLAIGY